MIDRTEGPRLLLAYHDAYERVRKLEAECRVIARERLEADSRDAVDAWQAAVREKREAIADRHDKRRKLWAWVKAHRAELEAARGHFVEALVVARQARP